MVILKKNRHIFYSKSALLESKLKEKGKNSLLKSKKCKKIAKNAKKCQKCAFQKLKIAFLRLRFENNH